MPSVEVLREFRVEDATPLVMAHVGDGPDRALGDGDEASSDDNSEVDDHDEEEDEGFGLGNCGDNAINVTGVAGIADATAGHTVPSLMEEAVSEPPFGGGLYTAVDCRPLYTCIPVDPVDRCRAVDPLQALRRRAWRM